MTDAKCWLIAKGLTRCDVVASELGYTAGVLGAICKVQRMIGKAFGIDPDKIDLHPYRSKITTMIWTALRLGF